MKGFIITCFILCTGYSGCTQKVIEDANAQKREVSGFHTIQVGDGIDLYLTQASEEAVAVSASKLQYRDRIKTEVKDGVLKFFYEGGAVSITWRNNRRLKAYVSAKELKALRAGGGSDVYLQSSLQADDFSLTLSGGSDFRGEINARNMEIRQSGGSDVHISGKVINLKVRASGGSDFNGYDLIAENVFASVSGGSDARVTATNELGAEASGGSDVHYKGNAVVKYKSSSGGSDITKRN